MLNRFAVGEFQFPSQKGGKKKKKKKSKNIPKGILHDAQSGQSLLFCLFGFFAPECYFCLDPWSFFFHFAIAMSQGSYTGGKARQPGTIHFPCVRTGNSRQPL